MAKSGSALDISCVAGWLSQLDHDLMSLSSSELVTVQPQSSKVRDWNIDGIWNDVAIEVDLLNKVQDTQVHALYR